MNLRAIYTMAMLVTTRGYHIFTPQQKPIIITPLQLRSWGCLEQPWHNLGAGDVLGIYHNLKPELGRLRIEHEAEPQINK